MALELTKNELNRLRPLLRDALTKTTVSRTWFVDLKPYFEFADRADKLFKSVDKHNNGMLNEWVGDAPAWSFFASRLVDRLIDAGVAQDLEPNTLLTSLKGFEDSESVADALLTDFSQLPYQYAYSFPLSNGITDYYQTLGAPQVRSGECRISGSWHPTSGVHFPQVAPEALPDPPFLGGLGGLFSLKPSLPGPLAAPAAPAPPPAPKTRPRLALQFLVTGYVSPEGFTSETEAQARSLLKSFIGLAVSIGVLRESRGLILRQMGAPVGNHQIHKPSGAGWLPMHDLAAPERDRRFIGTLECRDDGKADDLHRDLSSLVRLFAETKIATRLKLAGRWLFESYANEGQIMQYMQLAIAAEVLLGSTPGTEGLTKMLATRCAYLVATTASERDSIGKEFANLYELRSKIVHNGADRLSSAEHRMLHRLRHLCGRMVAAEIKLAIADLDKHREALIAALRKQSASKEATADD